MMQHLTNDPSFWVAFWAFLGMLFTALATLLGLLIAWAKSKQAQIEARDAKLGLAVTEKSLDRVEQAAGTVAAQVSTHSAQIAALQAQGTAAPPTAESVAQTAAQTAAQLVALGAQQAVAQIAAQAENPQGAAQAPAWQSSTVSYAAPRAVSAGDSRSAAVAPEGTAPAVPSPEQPAAGAPGATPA